MMKNKTMAGILCVCLLMLMTGCGAGEENGAAPENLPKNAFVDEAAQKDSAEENFPENSREDAEKLPKESAEGREPDGDAAAESADAQEEESAAEPTGAPAEEPAAEMPVEESAVENEYYQKLIDAVRKCIAGEEVEIPEEYDFSVTIHMFPNSDILGYFVEDVDGDGTEELIFGENWGEHTVIYNIYTISEDGLVRVADGSERNQYCLCENGMIANEGNSSAAESSYAYFTFDGRELHLVESVIYDGYKDMENPWFYSTESAWDAEHAEPVSEERAREIMGGYVYRTLTFIPFVSQN